MLNRCTELLMINLVKILRPFIAIIIALSFFSCDIAEQDNSQTDDSTEITNLIASVQSYFVPDRRVARLDVEAVLEGNKWTLIGETNLPNAKDSLLTLLSSSDIPVIDEIIVWPTNELGEKTFALTRHSVANLRSKKGHSQELATQVLLGTPLLVLKQEEEWYFVQCPDGYLAWIHGGELALKIAAEMEEWKQADRVIFVNDYGRSYQDQEMNHPIGDLVKGDILQRLASDGDKTQVIYPDGREAYISSAYLQPFDEYLEENMLAFTNSLAIAQQQKGKPYLWGGTSPKAMDCSGFTKTIYWQQGLIIPRDASQQVQAGVEVVYDENLGGLQEGDLLFFGRFREDGSEKITHVGMYIGNGRFIHSGSDNGANREESLWPDTPDFAPHRREALMRVKRMTVGSTGVISVKEHSWYFKQS